MNFVVLNRHLDFICQDSHFLSEIVFIGDFTDGFGDFTDGFGEKLPFQ